MADPNQNKISILVIGDESFQAFIQDHLIELDPESYDLHSETNSDEAYTTVENNDSFDIALIDDAFDHGQGLQTAIDTIELDIKFAIILFLSSDNLSTEKEAEEVGITTCLIKDKLTPYLLDCSIRFAQDSNSNVKIMRESRVELAKTLLEKDDRENKLKIQQDMLLKLAKINLSHEEHLNETFHPITEIAARTIGVERVGVWLYNKNLDEIHCYDLYNSERDEHEEGNVLKAKDFPKYFEAISKERTIAADDAVQDPRTSEFKDSYLIPNNIGAMMDAPIFLYGKIIGVVCHEHSGGTRSWLLEEQSFADSIADIVTLMIEQWEMRQTEKTMREREQHYRDRLEASNRELQDFASIISHDLQEPLYKVNAFGELLEQRCSDQLSDQAKEYIDKMRGSSKRMSTLIDDLLTFSRVTSRAKPFSKVDLNQELQGVLSDLEYRIEEEKAVLDIPTLITIDADPLQMRQLFQNLIGNGLKFHKENEVPRIKITGESDADGKTYCLTCKDEGIGFDQKYVDRIFGVFKRLHRASEYPGTGMGLAICEKIVKRHGGSITAESSPGHGASFIIQLPIIQKSEEEEANENHLSLFKTILE